SPTRSPTRPPEPGVEPPPLATSVPCGPAAGTLHAAASDCPSTVMLLHPTVTGTFTGSTAVTSSTTSPTRPRDPPAAPPGSPAPSVDCPPDAAGAEHSASSTWPRTLMSLQTTFTGTSTGSTAVTSSTTSPTRPRDDPPSAAGSPATAVD